jgi:hypothetical protein
VRRRPAATLAAAAAVWAAGCAREAGPAWDPAATRAVARAVETEAPGVPLVALDQVGGPGGAELPWGVRQSLATGGIPVTGEVPVPDARVLVFDSVRRAGDDLLVHTRTVHPAGAADSAGWRVRCSAGACQAERSP